MLTETSNHMRSHAADRLAVATEKARWGVFRYCAARYGHLGERFMSQWLFGDDGPRAIGGVRNRKSKIANPKSEAEGQHG
jgi:hypothetical protein